MILDQYIIKEIVQTFLAVITILFILFLGFQAGRFLPDALAGILPGVFVLKVLTTFTLRSMVLLVPAAVYLAVLLSFGRMYKDSEMTAITSCGIGIVRILKTVFVISCVISIFVAVLSLYVGPWAAERGIKIRLQARATADLAGLSAGQFKEFQENQHVYYVESISENKKQLKNVFIQMNSKTNMDIYFAELGYQHMDEKSGDRYLILQNGYRYQGVPGDPQFKIYKFEKGAVRIEQKELKITSQRYFAKSTQQLMKSKELRDVAELQWRISMPVSAILLALLGVLLSRSNPREGMFAKLLSAILIYVVYYNLMAMIQTGIKKGDIATPYAIWWVHGLLVVFMVLLYFKQYSFRRFF